MTTSSNDASPCSTLHLIPPSTLDTMLSAQFMVAWTGERSDGGSSRLGWWPTDLVWEDDANAVLADLLPRTHQWASVPYKRQL